MYTRQVHTNTESYVTVNLFLHAYIHTDIVWILIFDDIWYIYDMP